jgi:hypothetical protein
MPSKAATVQPGYGTPANLSRVFQSLPLACRRPTVCRSMLKRILFPLPLEWPIATFRWRRRRSEADQPCHPDSRLCSGLDCRPLVSVHRLHLRACPLRSFPDRSNQTFDSRSNASLMSAQAELVNAQGKACMDNKAIFPTWIACKT